jgi:hypothetical protein
MVGSPDAMPHIFEGAALRARRIRLYPSGGVLLHNPHDPSPDVLEHASTLRPFTDVHCYGFATSFYRMRVASPQDTR